MNNELNLDEGFSMIYLIPAFFIIGLGLVLFNVHTFIALPVILFGAMLLLAKTGVIITIDLKRAMSYNSLLGFRFGKPQDLSKFNRVRLVYTSDATLMQSRGSSNVVRAKTYDIKLSAITMEEVNLHEFCDYQLALSAYTCLVEKFNFHGVNEVADKQRQIAKNRPRARRR